MRTRTINLVGSLVGIGALVLLGLLVGWVLSIPTQPAAATLTSTPPSTGEASPVTPIPTAGVQLDRESTDLIAFESYRDGNSEIYLMKSDGSQPTNLTHDPAADIAPVWSPDGQRLAFFSNRTGHFQIYLVNAVEAFTGAAEASASQITYALEGMDYDLAVPLSWSPDGARLAAIASRSKAEDQPGQGQVDIIRVDGAGSTTALTFGGVPSGEPKLHWSPDGQQLALALESEIYIFTPDGASVVNVTEDENTEASHPRYFGLAWSPEGKRLAYLSHGPWLGVGPDAHAADDALARLTIFEPDTPKKIVDLELALVDIDGAYTRGLAWSPDGAYVSFRADSDQNGCWLIQLLHLDDAVVTTLRPVCHSQRMDDEPQWSPDGQRLLFTADPDGLDGNNLVIATINVADALGAPGNVTPNYLTRGSVDSYPRWQP